jgi:hypothetical protein
VRVLCGQFYRIRLPINAFPLDQMTTDHFPASMFLPSHSPASHSLDVLEKNLQKELASPIIMWDIKQCRIAL